MLIPSYLHGLFRDVKAACRRKVTQLKRGATWDDLSGDLIDTRDVPGLLVLKGPSPLLGGTPHFHMFAITQAIDRDIPRRLPRDTYETLFEPMIHTFWGFLSMLGGGATIFLHSSLRQQRLLHLAVRWWDALEAEGPRYTTGVDWGEPLWQVPTKLQYCLLHQGLPEALVHQPLPPGGLADLVAQTRGGLPPRPDELH